MGLGGNRKIQPLSSDYLVRLGSQHDAQSALAMLAERPLRVAQADDTDELPELCCGQLVRASASTSAHQMCRFEAADCLIHILRGRLVVRRATSPDGEYADELIGEGESLVIPAGGWFALLATPTSTVGLAWLNAYGVGSTTPETRTTGASAAPQAPDYYWGYDERYRAVYEAGAQTWETRAPNEAVEYLVRLGSVPVGRVLDLGCGEGRDSIFLAQHGYSVTGVDVSPVALTVARSLASDAGVLCQFLERDVIYLRNLPFPRYDIAINMGCLHMLSDPDSRSTHLNRVYEVLEPEGLFLVAHCRERWGEGFASVPNYAELGRLLPGQVTERKIHTRDGDKLLPLSELPYHEATDDELRGELERAGFAIERDLSDETYAFGSTVVFLCRKSQGSA